MSEDAYAALGRALAIIIKQAVREGVQEALEQTGQALPSIPSNQALLISVAEAARRIGLGRTKVYELIDAGKFPHKRIGRALLVPVKDLEKWVNEVSE